MLWPELLTSLNSSEKVKKSELGAEPTEPAGSSLLDAESVVWSENRKVM